MRASKSPFVGDARHIHHYLLRRGFTHSQTLVLLVSISTAFGAVGYVGWKLRVPETYLFWAFFFGFFGYHFWIKRAWAEVDRARKAPSALDIDEEVLTAK
jgi:UDP-GlcNAc:undecaprenyl-phosphate GlcNAc-1-phosphate transferase